MKSKSKYEEVLNIINESIIPKIVDLLNDLGDNEIIFVPQKCYDFKIKRDGTLWVKSRNNGLEWEIRSHSKENKRFITSDIDSLKRIMLGCTKALVKLREIKKQIDLAIQEAKDLGALTDIFKREMITEKTEKQS